MKLKAGETLNIKFTKYEKSSLTSITTLKFENWTFVKTGRSWDFSDIIVQVKMKESMAVQMQERVSRGGLCSVICVLE